MNESEDNGEKESTSSSFILGSQKESKYPFMIPDNQSIVFTDLSQTSAYLMVSDMITSETKTAFVENTSPFFSSIKEFKEDQISEDEIKKISKPSPIEKFISRLYEEGFTSSFVLSHFFQIELSLDESRGLIVYDCNTLPNIESSEESLKIVCCPESSLHYEKNFDFVLACFGKKVPFLFFFSSFSFFFFFFFFPH